MTKTLKDNKPAPSRSCFNLNRIAPKYDAVNRAINIILQKTIKEK